MRNAVHIYVTPTGGEFVLPHEVWRKAKWRKDGMLDKRYAGNAEAAAYLRICDIADLDDFTRDHAVSMYQPT